MFAVAIGEMFDHIEFFGPFDSFDDAQEWGDATHWQNWWVVRLEEPQ